MPETSKPLSRLARAADVLAATLLMAGAIALYTAGFDVRIGGVRLSIHSVWRPFLFALVTLGVRHWFVPISLRFRWPRPLRLSWPSPRAGGPLTFDERQLFGERPTWPQRLGRLALLVFGFSALTAALTWPQVLQLDSVPDLDDPLFYVWCITWISHQIVRNPLRLFDGNIFHPEPLTLTYSDSLIVPGLMSAPLLWIGVHPVLVYNLGLLSAIVLSGVTMFLLVRALTGRVDAAMVAGAIFVVYPYRLEHYSHYALQMTMWMPLALLGLHRTIASGRLRDGLATGLAFALQTLSSLYYGCFLAVYMVVLGGVLWLGRGRPRPPIRALVAGVVLAAVLIAPVASQHLANLSVMGSREEGTIQFYSAEGSDYLRPTYRSRLYSRWSNGAHPERDLFPLLMPVILTGVAIWPPLSVARIAYVLALVLAVDGSFGFNGPTFTVLHAVLLPYRQLRVPARFSLLAGMTLAILAGYGATRLFERWPRQRVLLTAAALGLIVIEATPLMRLRPVWHEPPPIYASISNAESPVVLAEFPMPRDIYRSGSDARYLYFSTFHWQNIVNGSSGFFPPSYVELLANERDFPNEASLSYLRSRGVQYLTMHGRFTNAARYGETISWLDARPDLELVAVTPWEGSESRLYRLR